MKVELKKFKHAPSMSQETEAFTADLWIDDKKAAYVGNTGQGGATDFDFDDRKLEQEFYKYCLALPAVKSKHGDLPMSADLFVALLVEKLVLKKQLTTWCKHSVIYRHKDTPKGSWYKSKMKFTPAVAETIRVRAGDNFALIANEDIDKAVDFVTSLP
jgi:hypothetical protein